MATISLGKIHPYEYLFIKRLRLKLSQVKMAKIYGVTRHQYSEIELGLKFPNFWVEQFNFKYVEKCILHRRRLGLKQGELANILGVTRTWIRLMETGGRNPARLIEYWRL